MVMEVPGAVGEPVDANRSKGSRSARLATHVSAESMPTAPTPQPGVNACTPGSRRTEPRISLGQASDDFDWAVAIRQVHERGCATPAHGSDPGISLTVLSAPHLPESPTVRTTMLAAIEFFFERATNLEAVQRIALVGSIVTPKPVPRDIDILVTVANDVDLRPLAHLSRQTRGRVQSINHGCDVFVANPAGRYVGRMCVWKTCRPGIRVACDAQHCGRREFLHDDFQDLQLSDELIRQPPLELWPTIVVRCTLPADVEALVHRLHPETDPTPVDNA
jgi:hypothetical protein